MQLINAYIQACKYLDKSFAKNPTQVRKVEQALGFLFSSSRDVRDEVRYNNGAPNTFDSEVANNVYFKLLTPSRVSVS